MATYECSKCGMGVNASCAKCDSPLVDDVLELDDGKKCRYQNAQMVMGKSNLPCAVARI